MSIAQELKYQADLSSGTAVVSINSPLVAGDDRAQTFRVSLTENGSNPNLSNVSCSAYFVRGKTQSHDADTIPLDGEIVGSDALVTLTSGCYTRNCYFALTIKLTNSSTGEKRTILIARGTVMKSQDGSLVDPDGTIPTLDDIFAQIEAMEAATDNANNAAEYANQAASAAINTTLQLMGVAAPAIVQSVYGNGVVSVSDSAERSLSGLSVFGKTTQDGTPTPEAPVPMVNAGAGGSIGVQVCGKNLFDLSKLWIGNNVQCETNGNSVHISTNSANTYSGCRVPAITMHAGIEYVLSADVSDIVSGTPSLGFRDADTMKYIKRAYVSDGRIVLTYTPTETIRAYAYLLVTGSTASDGDATFANIQLEVSASATAYEPYKDGGSMTIATPNGLPGLPVDSGGNYTDASGQQWICDEIDFVRKVYVKRVHHAIYDGGITPYSSAVRDNTVRITLYNNNPRLADNHVNAVGNMTVQAAVFYDDRVGHSVSNTGTSTGWHLSLPKAIVGNTVDSLRAWLKNNPAEIMYVMATPVETPLSPEELTGSTSLTAQYPNTTAFTDAGAGMKMEYIADTKLYIDNKFAALAAASVDA